MNNVIKINGNELSINGKIIKFRYDIRDTNFTDIEKKDILK